MIAILNQNKPLMQDAAVGCGLHTIKGSEVIRGERCTAVLGINARATDCKIGAAQLSNLDFKKHAYIWCTLQLDT
jgi:hypothetical protein